MFNVAANIDYLDAGRAANTAAPNTMRLKSVLPAI